MDNKRKRRSWDLAFELHLFKRYQLDCLRTTMISFTGSTLLFILKILDFCNKKSNIIRRLQLHLIYILSAKKEIIPQILQMMPIEIIKIISQIFYWARKCRKNRKIYSTNIPYDKSKCWYPETLLRLLGYHLYTFKK